MVIDDNDPACLQRVLLSHGANLLSPYFFRAFSAWAEFNMILVKNLL